MNKTTLMVPMYRLHYLQSVDDEQYDSDSPSRFKEFYDFTERTEIYEALEWAMENPNYDFKSFPSYEDLRHSNTEIFRYLAKLYEFMKENKLNEE